MSSETPQAPDQAPGAPAEGAPTGGAPRPPSHAGARGPRTGGPRPFGPPGARRPRRKVCIFCVDKVKRIDYKDRPRLQRFLSDRARIDPRRKSGTCAKHQRMLTTALKRARFMALLPYTAEHVRAMMSARDRALAGGPPPPRPERPPYRPYGAGAPRPEGGAPRPPEAPRPAEGPRPAGGPPPAA
jgi:small subunit ribosomal protein S18